MKKKTSKKMLLEEATIRRFMGLANMTPLTEDFINQLKEEDDEELDEPAPDMDDEMGGEMEPEMGGEMEPEMGGEDELGEPGMEDPMMGGEDSALAGLSEEEIGEVVQTIVDAIAEKSGIEIGVDVEPAGGDMDDVGGEMEPEMGGEMEPEMGGEMEGGEELPGGEMEGEEDEEPLAEGEEAEDDEKPIKERRALGPDHAREKRGEGSGHVAERLSKKVAELVMERLTAALKPAKPVAKKVKK